MPLAQTVETAMDPEVLVKKAALVAPLVLSQGVAIAVLQPAGLVSQVVEALVFVIESARSAGARRRAAERLKAKGERRKGSRESRVESREPSR